MNINATKYFAKVRECLEKLDKRKKNQYIVIFLLCLLIAVGVSMILNRKDYIVLYRNLDTVECAEIAAKLDEMNVGYKVENTSTILVTKKDEPNIRLRLAGQGYPKSSLNYDIFTDNINFMTTDYEKTQYNLFQLQERLASTIETINVITDAIVTITLPDSNIAIFNEDKNAATASVVLKVMNGVSLTEQQINGIAQLVSKSVPKLDAANISVIDQNGIVLNDEGDETFMTTSGRLVAEKEVSNLYSERITNVLIPIYGKDAISVGVNVVLDFDTKFTEIVDYKGEDGNSGVISGFEQYYEGKAGAGGSGGVPGTDSNTDVPGYVTPDTSQTDDVISNKVNIDYLVDYMKQQIQKQGAEIKEVTVSVLIDKDTMTNEEKNNLISIVSNTAGISSEKVALINMPFKKADIVEPQPTPIPTLWEQIINSEYFIYGVIGVSLFCGLLILTIVLIIIRGRKKRRRLIQETKRKEEAIQSEEVLRELTELAESKEQQLSKEIREFSLKSPHITAMLLRTLLKGETD